MARFAILIGNSEYPEEPALNDLRCPEQDVDDFASVLEDPELGAFVKVQKVKNQSHHSVLDKIYDLLNQAGREDLVLIYFSGHGELDDKGGVVLGDDRYYSRAPGSTCSSGKKDS